MTSLDDLGGNGRGRHALRHRRGAGRRALSHAARGGTGACRRCRGLLRQAGPARQCAAHRGAADGRGPRRAAPGISRDRRDSGRAARTTSSRSPRFYRETADALAALLREGKSVGLAGRGRSVLLRLLHAYVAPAGVGFPGRGRARRHRHVGLLDARQPADDLGQRHPGRAARHPGRGPAGRAAAAHRCRGDHEGRQATSGRCAAPSRPRACCRARSMSSAAPCRTSASCRWPNAASPRAPISPWC